MGRARRHNRRVLPLLLFAAVAVVAGGGAREGRADSKYSLVFLGDRMWPGDVRAVSLGSDYQLLDDSLSLQYNPAAYSTARRFTFSATGYVTTDRGSSEDWKETDTSFKFGFFAFAVPIVPRLTVGLGYRGRYDAVSAFVTELETGSGDRYGEFYNRSGGLISFPFTAAVHLAKFVQVGGYFSVEKGNLENRWDIIFADPTVNPANSTQTWDLSGTGYGLGLVLRPGAGLLLGATYEGEIEYDTEIRERHTNPISNADYERTSVLPERWTFSAAWRFHRSFAAYGTYSTSDFTQLQGTVVPTSRLFRENIVSVGFEYLRGVRISDARFPLRLGLTYSPLPYSFPSGERVASYMVELGVGLLFRRGRGKLDLGLQGGVTGDLSTNLIENRTFRIFVGISGAEIWRRNRQSEF